jgi:hypothetical protein
MQLVHLVTAQGKKPWGNLGLRQERPVASRYSEGIVIESSGTPTEPFRIHAHMLRHAAGYALAARGVDTRTLQAFMGHRSIASGRGQAHSEYLGQVKRCEPYRRLGRVLSRLPQILSCVPLGWALEPVSRVASWLRDNRKRIE